MSTRRTFLQRGGALVAAAALAPVAAEALPGRMGPQSGSLGTGLAASSKRTPAKFGDGAMGDFAMRQAAPKVHANRGMMYMTSSAKPWPEVSADMSERTYYGGWPPSGEYLTANTHFIHARVPLTINTVDGPLELAKGDTAVLVRTGDGWVRV